MNYFLKWFAGESIVLCWALNGPNVSAHWRADHVGVCIEPSTERDHGSSVIWVPDGPGEYIVEVKLVRASDGILLTSGSTAILADED
ncbi:hypothetical protein ABZ260_41870 [Streptosporangium sp. NPDC006013]|uniref:hypothetical protein n=1 Tax=Streptosporangium sp. NPDC006013 TaxID=3155596 RepID=UPI0033BC5B55